MARHAGGYARLRDAASTVVDSDVLIGERDDGVNGAPWGAFLGLFLLAIFVPLAGAAVCDVVVRIGDAAAPHSLVIGRGSATAPVSSEPVALLQLFRSVVVVSEDVDVGDLSGCGLGRSEEARSDERGY